MAEKGQACPALGGQCRCPEQCQQWECVEVGELEEEQKT